MDYIYYSISCVKEREKMSKPPQPEPWRIYLTIIVGLGWLFALALWLFYYAASFSIIQNLGALILSLVVAGIIIIPLWVPWALKNAS
jgi:membrane protein YdbS with pleckstrin-like domain